MRRSSRARFCRGIDGSQPSLLLIKRIVAAAAANSLRSVQLVVALDLDAGDFLGEIHEPVDGHHLGASNVDGIDDVAFHERARSMQDSRR